MLLYISKAASTQVCISANNSTPHPSAALEVKSTTKGLLPPRLTLEQRVAIQNPAQGLLVFQTDQSVGLYSFSGQNWEQVPTITANASKQFYLGQDTLGGIVFYLFTGANNRQHGLIVSKIETVAAWQSVISKTNGDRPDDGVYNTQLMTNSPAKDWIKSNLGADWYLPSLDELMILFYNRYHVNKTLRNTGNQVLTYTAYWSSTEFSMFNDNTVFVFDFVSSNQAGGQKNTPLSVRGIKAF
jgi:hypothetical protein